mgnify:FL=1
MEDGNGEGRELALPTGALLLAVIAALWGWAGAGGASLGAGGAAAVAQFADSYRKRRDGRRVHRVEALARELDRRLRHVELQLSEEHLDLFMEVLGRALQDDENDKTPIYSGVLEWIAKEQPQSSRVRILANAVQHLSYVELFALLWEIAGGNHRDLLAENGLDEGMILHRRAAHGLAEHGGVRYNGSPTSLGVVLSKYCPLTSIRDPHRKVPR